jgi:hypothetical protein
MGARLPTSKRGVALGVAGGLGVLMLLCGGLGTMLVASLGLPRAGGPGMPGGFGDVGPASNQPSIVTLLIRDVVDNDTAKVIGDKLPGLADGGAQKRTDWKLAGEIMTATISPAADPKAVADRIDFGTVTAIRGRTIHVEARKASAAPKAVAQ